MAKFTFQGKFPAHVIYWQEVASTRKIDSRLEKLAEQEWKKLVRKCKKEGRRIWDSQLYRLEKLENYAGKVSFTVSTIPFSVRIGLRKFSGEIKKKGLAYAPLGMFTRCLVKSREGKFLFIEKSDKYFATRKFSWIGGVLSKTEREIKGGDDLFAETKKEIKEETGAREIEEIFLKGGYVTQSFNFCLFFEARLRETVPQLRQRLKHLRQPETKRLIVVDEEEMGEFIKTKMAVEDWEKCKRSSFSYFEKRMK